MKHILLLIIIVVTSFPICFGQRNNIPELKLNSSIVELIHVDTTHLFKIDLQKETFLFGIIQQLGVDIKIEILDSNKYILKEINHQNQAYGPEQLAFTSSKKGTYFIRISTISLSSSGKYSISINKIQKAANTKAQSVDELFSFYDRPGHPGVAVAVVENGELAYTAGYGMANLPFDVAIEHNTTFHIGSETKQFVAFAIASLIFEGQLNRDDDIRKHLPEVPLFSDTIRIKHLLSHTSGLREIYDDLSAIAGWQNGAKSIDVIQYQKELNFKPAEKYSYCNTEYGLLQEIFERTSGKKLSDWLRNKVFSPLQMNQTFFCEDSKTVIDNFATGYAINYDGNFIQNIYLPNGVISSATDLSKWILNYESPVIGNDTIFNIMFQSDTLKNGEKISYMSGQERIKKEGKIFWGHGGGFEGYKSYILRCPEEHFGVVVLSNFNYFNNWFMARKVANIYLGIDLTEVEVAAPTHKPISISPDKLAKNCGTYWFDHNLSIQISKKDTALWTQIKGQSEYPIIPHDNGKFYYHDTEISIEFKRNEGGMINNLIIWQDGEVYNASRQKPKAKTAQYLSRFTGSYYCKEIETIYTIEESRENILIAKHPRIGTVELKLFWSNYFTGNKWFFKSVEFIEDTNGVTGFKLSSGRVKNLWFEKL